MNQVGEKINFDEKIKSCRVFDPKETIAQMRGMNPYKYMCWGATKFTVDNARKPRMLRFYVTGMRHTGHIYVFLNGADLYDVYICTNRGTIKEVGTDLYFDMLTDWIDNRIEKTAAHRF
jgi:hypothetical protein